MYIDEIKFIKSDKNEINKKIFINKLMTIAYCVVIILSIAYMIYAGVKKITDYTPYLSAGMVIFGAVAFIVNMYYDCKRYKIVVKEIDELGSAVLHTNQYINAKYKHNISTYVYLVTSIILFILTVVTIIYSSLYSNIVNLSMILVVGFLFLLILYQTINMFIIDKLFRACVLDKNTQRFED